MVHGTCLGSVKVRTDITTFTYYCTIHRFMSQTHTHESMSDLSRPDPSTCHFTVQKFVNL